MLVLQHFTIQRAASFDAAQKHECTQVHQHLPRANNGAK